MATDRRGRRRRHKRHKDRSRAVSWRYWPLWLRGQEWADLAAFIGSDCSPRVCIAEGGPIHGQTIVLPHPCAYWRVPEVTFPSLSMRYKSNWVPPPVRVSTFRVNTYRVVPQREGRLFFCGTVRRYRNLPSRLVLEEAADGN